MKFEDLKVGMKIKPIDNTYYITNVSNKWEGEIVAIHPDSRTFTAKTIVKGKIMFDRKYLLAPEYFTPIEEKKQIETCQELVKVLLVKDTISVFYKGKLVTRAKCAPNDKFNEEFGLNLALRRFCKTLPDINEKEIIIKQIDKVENYI